MLVASSCWWRTLPHTDVDGSQHTANLRRTGQLSGIEVGGHGGTLQLPDGRLIAVDDAQVRVLACRVERTYLTYMQGYLGALSTALGG